MAGEQSVPSDGPDRQYMAVATFLAITLSAGERVTGTPILAGRKSAG